MNCGPLAQLAEHLTFNQGVVGSNPSRPTSQLALIRGSGENEGKAGWF